MTIALCLQSCATSRQQTDLSQERQEEDLRAYADSLTTLTRIELKEAVPMQTARLTLPLQSLRDLPRGATLRESSGRATASLTVRGDTVWVDAVCDSLERVCSVYEKTVERLHAENARLSSDIATREKARDAPGRWGGVIFIAGLAAGSLLTTLTGKIRYGSNRRN